MTDQTPNSKIKAILYGLVDWAESGRSTLGRPDTTVELDQAATQLQQLIIEARIDELDKFGVKTGFESYQQDYAEKRKAQLNKEVDNG